VIEEGHVVGVISVRDLMREWSKRQTTTEAVTTEAATTEAAAAL
jgi:signal-transduction protein with cAMP-binding, CBS, and nucleotidyltransferase domain